MNTVVHLTRLTPIFLVSALVNSTRFAVAQPQVDIPLTSEVKRQQSDAALEDFRASFGSKWRTVRDVGTGYSKLLYGGSVPPAFEPRTDEEWEQVALEHISNAAEVHGIDPSTLIATRGRGVKRLALTTVVGGLDKVVVLFEQWAGALPVVDGVVKVMMSPWGELISLTSTASPVLHQVSLTIGIDAVRARELAGRAFRSAHTLHQETTMSEPELVVKRSRGAGGIQQAGACWQLECWSATAKDGSPVAERLWINAASGRVVDRRSLVDQFDVSGTVYTMATPPLSNRPDVPTNPPVTIPLAHAEVWADGAQMVRTNADGQFNFVGLQGPVVLTFGYEGAYVTVINDAGPEHTLTEPNVSGSGNVVELNASPNEDVTAQANAYVVVGVVADFIRDFGGDATILDDASSVTARVNYQGLICHGFAAGQEFRLGPSSAECENAAFGSFIVHELGHILDRRSFSVSLDGPLSEGNADTWAVYVMDDPLVFRDHRSEGSGRSADNDWMFCGDEIPNCNVSFLQQDGQGHLRGTLWSGTAWAIRDHLNQALGNALGDEVANRLFLAWIDGNTNERIQSVIQLEWLLLDDDDMDLSNLTPNYCAIRAGFAQHGWPDPCLDGCP